MCTGQRLSCGNSCLPPLVSWGLHSRYQAIYEYLFLLRPLTGSNLLNQEWGHLVAEKGMTRKPERHLLPCSYRGRNVSQRVIFFHPEALCLLWGDGRGLGVLSLFKTDKTVNRVASVESKSSFCPCFSPLLPLPLLHCSP